MYDTSSTVSWLRTSHGATANTATLPSVMAMLMRSSVYIFSMKAGMTAAIVAPITSSILARVWLKTM